MNRLANIYRFPLKKETLFILFVTVLIMSYNTVLIEQYNLYVNYIAKLTIIAFLFIFFKHRIISGNQVLIVFLYSMLLIYGLMIATFNGQFTLSLPLTMKYGLRIIAFIGILMILNTKRYSDNIVKFPIWIGVILSLQSIALFVMISSGNAPEPDYINIRGKMRSYGIWGFAPSITWGYNNILIPRVSSFFSEASNFTRFLEYPVIISFGYYKIYRGKINFLFMVICLLAFILTFSMTGYLSMILAFIVFYMLKTRKNIAKISILAFCILFIFSFHIYLKETYIPNPHQRNFVQHMILSKYGDALRATTGIKGLYGGRVYSTIEAAKVFYHNSFGVGLLNNEDIEILKKNGEDAYTKIHLFGALLFWLIKTGFIGLITFILIFFSILKNIKTFWFNRNDIRIYISIAFICIAIHHLIVGDWFDPMFLFVMALILSYHGRGGYRTDFKNNDLPTSGRPTVIKR